MILYPMRLKPCYKDYLWGGSRLKTEYGKADAPEITAESWELACSPSGMSVVAEGPAAGMTLEDLGRLDRRACWGSACRGEEFPLLVKLLDASESLSVQVHPSRQNADLSLGERGKLELWYILECRPRSSLYLGLSRQLTREELLEKACDGTICQVLNKVQVAPGDVFCVYPGTVHAIGAGIVLAEIQQNSDTTFRLWDYGRRDRQGRTRSLQLDRAAAVADMVPIIPSECRANSRVQFEDFTLSELYSGQCFRSYRLDVQTGASLSCSGDSFCHLLCIRGESRICCGGQTYPARQGDSFFLPAALGSYEICGKSSFLLSRM